MNKDTRVIRIKTKNGQNFRIDVQEVLEHRIAAMDEDDIKDWFENDMNWYECKTLIELERDDERTHKLEIEECEIEEA